MIAFIFFPVTTKEVFQDPLARTAFPPKPYPWTCITGEPPFYHDEPGTVVQVVRHLIHFSSRRGPETRSFCPDRIACPLASPFMAINRVTVRLYLRPIR